MSALFAAAAFCGIGHASAQNALNDAFNHCNDMTRSADERIAACTTAATAQGIGDDERAFAYVDLGQVYVAKGSGNDALQAFNRAAALKPDVWQTYANRAGVYLQLGDFDSALKDYNHLLQIDPNSVPMFRNDVADYRTLPEGVTTNESSQSREAAQHVAALAQLKGELTSAFAYRCQQREMGTGVLDSALADCNTSLLLDPANSKVLVLRGVVHLRRKEIAEGRADFDSAIKADPKFADAIYLRGVAEGMSGDAAAAKADAAAAVAIDPTVAQKFAPKPAAH